MNPNPNSEKPTYITTPLSAAASSAPAEEPKPQCYGCGVTRGIGSTSMAGNMCGSCAREYYRGL